MPEQYWGRRQDAIAPAEEAVQLRRAQVDGRPGPRRLV